MAGSQGSKEHAFLCGYGSGGTAWIQLYLRLRNSLFTRSELRLRATCLVFSALLEDIVVATAFFLILNLLPGKLDALHKIEHCSGSSFLPFRNMSPFSCAGLPSDPSGGCEPDSCIP